MTGKRPGMYAANTDARVPRVKSAARILGVAAMVAPNPTTTYAKAMRQDAAAQAAAELALGVPDGYSDLEASPLSGSPGGIPSTPMPGGYNAWARRGSASSIVSASGSEGSAVSIPAPGSGMGSEGGSDHGSKVYMMQGTGGGHLAGRRRREMVPSSYESSFSDGPHPHAYASPPRGYAPGSSLGRGRSWSNADDTGRIPTGGRSASGARSPGKAGGATLARADSLPARPGTTTPHSRTPSHSNAVLPADPAVARASTRSRPYPSPSYSTDSYSSYHSNSNHISPGAGTGVMGGTPSPAALRHPMTRLLSPDLPPRDALYLFCNFASYMRSPQEGAEGIRDNTDFGDTIRLLDFARNQASDPRRNVHILHLKYRFQTPDQGLPMTRTEKLASLGKDPDYAGKYNGNGVGRTVPQPFSVVNDPVVKIDYQDNGVFNPLPAQAVFNHIAKTCQPPPRIIVVSYVCSKATENHVASIAHWAHTSAPPIYVFSPLETRLRENRPLEEGLHHAIPISMYAWPLPPPSSPNVDFAGVGQGVEAVSGMNSPNALPLAHGQAIPRTPMTARPSRSNTDPSSKIYKSPLPRRRTDNDKASTGVALKARLRQAVTPLTSPQTSPMSPGSATSPESPSSTATTASIGHSPSAARFGFGGGYSNEASTAGTSGANSPTSPMSADPTRGDFSIAAHRDSSSPSQSGSHTQSPASPTTAKARRTFTSSNNVTPSPGNRSPSSPGACSPVTSSLPRSRSSTSASHTGIYTYAPSSLSPRIYPPDPVATLSVITHDSLTDGGTGELIPDRIPLWALAPGVGVLHGSTAVSLGVKLGDFSAFNLAGRGAGAGPIGGAGAMGSAAAGAARTAPGGGGDAGRGGNAAKLPESMVGASEPGVPLHLQRPHTTSAGGVEEAGEGIAPVPALMPLLDGARAARSRASSLRTATPEPISRPGSAVSIRSIAGGGAGAAGAVARKIGITHHGANGSAVAVHISHELTEADADRVGGAGAGLGAPTIHLTPPNQDPRHLSPPDMRPARPAVDTSFTRDPSPGGSRGGAGQGEQGEPGNKDGNGNGAGESNSNDGLKVQGTGVSTADSWPTPKSWPTLPNKIPGWKRGRREVMEDALEEVSAMAVANADSAAAAAAAMGFGDRDATAVPRERHEPMSRQNPDPANGGALDGELGATHSSGEYAEVGSVPMEREARIGFGLGFKVDVNDDVVLARQMGELQVGSVEWDRGDAVLYALRYGQSGV